MNWISQLGPVKTGEVIAIDGKQMRGAKDIRAGKEGLYMVSAWAVEQGIVLGQRKVDEKSNEITAIPELLDVLAVEGCVVTIDAMGCSNLAPRMLSALADGLPLSIASAIGVRVWT